jgi:tetratricopeptide (TPR) repeat protein
MNRFVEPEELSVRVKAMLIGIVAITVGCQLAGDRHAPKPVAAKPDACELVLFPRTGTSPLEANIRALQETVRQNGFGAASLEKLGWGFVAQARMTQEAAAWAQAEASARCIEAHSPNSAEALLLQAYVLENQHRFHDAEALARQLTARRELPFDYGLLGDALMEQGRLDEALVAYQKMMDLRPGLESYSRAAHLRWLKGYVEGAAELMQMAVAAGSRRLPEPAAWAEVRLALYELQLDRATEAMTRVNSALALVADYAPALHARGRILLAEDQPAVAVESLSQAAKLTPLPEIQWAWLEALEEAKQDGAAAVESELLARGRTEDPRSFALFLATRHPEQAALAVRLATDELQTRGDVFTHDALGWALAAAGEWKEASAESQQALSAGTQDARLFLHAGVIALRSERRPEASELLRKAAALRRMLLPSERRRLSSALNETALAATDLPAQPTVTP